MKFIKEINYKGILGTSIDVRIQPNSPKNQVVGLHNEKLKIKIKSPAVEGKANECLISYLSEVFEMAKSRVHLLRGDTCREKTLFIEGLNALQILENLKKCCSALK
jgi:uncharacterized protein (TIGR00251 family)